MATGGALAAAIAQRAAISNFFLGPTLGSLYYSLFPVSASMGLVIASTGTMMAAMAIILSFVGFVSDPLQAKLGIHQRRLRLLVKSLEAELKGSGESRFELKDRYVARVFDLLDFIKAVSAV